MSVFSIYGKDLLVFPSPSLKKNIIGNNILYPQVIYNEVLANYPEKVREKVLFKNATKAMHTARSEGKPTTPPSIDDVIKGFEEGTFPQKFNDMYLGHVKVKIKGEIKIVFM